MPFLPDRRNSIQVEFLAAGEPSAFSASTLSHEWHSACSGIDIISARNSSAVNSEAMMKRRVLVAALVGTLGAGTTFAQTQTPSQQTTPRPQTSGAAAQTPDTAKPTTDAP